MKYLLITSVLSIFCVIVNAQTFDKNDTIKSSQNQSANKEEVPVVEELPQFPGGSNNMAKFIAENYKYSDKTNKKLMKKFVLPL